MVFVFRDGSQLAYGIGTHHPIFLPFPGTSILVRGPGDNAGIWYEATTPRALCHPIFLFRVLLSLQQTGLCASTPCEALFFFFFPRRWVLNRRFCCNNHLDDPIWNGYSANRSAGFRGGFPTDCVDDDASSRLPYIWNCSQKSGFPWPITIVPWPRWLWLPFS